MSKTPKTSLGGVYVKNSQKLLDGVYVKNSQTLLVYVKNSETLLDGVYVVKCIEIRLKRDILSQFSPF